MAPSSPVRRPRRGLPIRGPGGPGDSAPGGPPAGDRGGSPAAGRAVLANAILNDDAVNDILNGDVNGDVNGDYRGNVSRVTVHALTRARPRA